MLTLKQFRVVLVETTHPGNIGAAARAMANMGVAELALIRPKEFPSVRATARAAGADDILDNTRLYPDLAAAVADCQLVLATSARLRSVSWPQLHPGEVASFVAGALPEAAPDTRVALVFGRERSGLKNEELDLCQALVHIPVDPAHTSLNLAAAVMVMLYALRTGLETLGDDVVHAVQAVGAKHHSPPADSVQFERFFAQLDTSLKRIDFYKGNAELVMRKLRKLFYKSQASREELNILQGVVRVMNERLDQLEGRRQ